MVIVFYAAFGIAILASIKVICCLRVDKAVLYFVTSILATSLIFIHLDSYFSAIVLVLLFIGAITVLFLFIDYYLKIRTDVIENNLRGISPKIWLGPLIFAFILLVSLFYGIISADYKQLTNTTDVTSEMTLSSYLLIGELILFLLLGSAVIAYHFTRHLFLVEKAK